MTSIAVKPGNAAPGSVTAGDQGAKADGAPVAQESTGGEDTTADNDPTAKQNTGGNGDVDPS
jgi:hypothetical protein